MLAGYVFGWLPVRTGKKANKRQPEPTFRYQTITCFFAGK
jgi:hypothetical protein